MDYSSLQAMTLRLITKFGADATYNDGTTSTTVKMCKVPERVLEETTESYGGEVVGTLQTVGYIYSSVVIKPTNLITFGSKTYMIESVTDYTPDGASNLMYHAILKA